MFRRVFFRILVGCLLIMALGAPWNDQAAYSSENDYGYYLSWCTDKEKLSRYLFKYYQEDKNLAETFGLVPQSEYELYWIGRTTFCKVYYSNKNDPLCLGKGKEYWTDRYEAMPLVHRESLAYHFGANLADLVGDPYIIEEKYETVQDFIRKFTRNLEKHKMLTAAHYFILGFIKGLQDKISMEKEDPILAYSEKYDRNNYQRKADYLQSIHKKTQVLNDWVDYYGHLKNNQKLGYRPPDINSESCEELDFRYKNGVVQLSKKLDGFKEELGEITSEINDCTENAKSLTDMEIQNSSDTEIRDRAEKLAKKANEFADKVLDFAKCTQENFLKYLVDTDINEDYYAETVLLEKRFLLQAVEYWHEIQTTAASGFPLSHEAKKINRILDEKLLTYVAVPEQKGESE